MRAAPIAVVTAGVLLVLAGCGSDGSLQPRVDYNAARSFCTTVGDYASELAQNMIPAPASITEINDLAAAGREIDATDATHPGMAMVALAIVSDRDADLPPAVAKAQAYCVDVGFPELSGSPGSTPPGLLP